MSPDFVAFTMKQCTSRLKRDVDLRPSRRAMQCYAVSMFVAVFARRQRGHQHSTSAIPAVSRQVENGHCGLKARQGVQEPARCHHPWPIGIHQLPQVPQEPLD